MKSAEQKKHEWKLKRCGKITASVLPDLMISGRAKDDLKIEEKKEKIAQYYRKQGINV